MKTYEAKPFLSGKYMLGEAPTYDVRNGKFSFVDITEGKLYIASEEKILEEADFGQMVGAAVPLETSGGYTAFCKDGIYLYKEKEISLLKSLTDTYESYQRSNDAKADPFGRLWFGSVSADDDHGPSGNLYRYDGGKIAVMQQGTKIANGMAWNAKRDRFFFSDSLCYAVLAYDYDKATGDVSGRKELFDIEGGVPDGMCIDSEDNLWVAIWGGRRIEKRSSVTGQLLATVNVPAENVTSCCFYGPQLDKLFITSSGNGLSGQYDGCLFTCDVEVKGCATDYAKV